MQSHASRHVVSEFLKDLHPDLSEPFPKVYLSTPFCSKKPYHNIGWYPSQGVITDEIALAYGRRGITKASGPASLHAQAMHVLQFISRMASTTLVHHHLPCLILQLVAVLALPDDVLESEDERAHALRIFNALLSTQVRVLCIP